MRRESQSSVKRLLPYLALAVLIHLALVPWLPGLLPAESMRVPYSEVVTVPVPDKEWKRNEVIATEPVPVNTRKAERLEDKKKQEEEKEKLRGQVVDIQRPLEEKEPDDSDFVSEYASSVEKQTKSRYQKKDYENATAKPAVTKKDVEEIKRIAGEGSGDEIVLGADRIRKKRGEKEKKQALLIPRQEKHTELSLREEQRGEYENRSPSRAMKGNNPNKLRVSPDLLKKPKQRGEAGADKENLPKLADLMPDFEVLDHIRGAPANDYLPDLDESDETLLNTRKSYLAAYINRIKRTVSQFWRPREALFLAVRNGEILSPRDYVTELHVELNPDGSLHRLSLSSGSGIDEFDQAGLKAFEEAGSFPNPPPAIKDPDGMIRFNFSFALVLAGASRPLFQLTLSPAVEGWLNSYRRGLVPPPR